MNCRNWWYGTISAQSREPTVGYCYWASVADCIGQLLGQRRRLIDYSNLPTFSRNLAQYRPYTKPIDTFTMASNSENRRVRVQLMDGTLLGHVSFLPRQTILKVRKPEFGTALVSCCAENKCWRPEFGPELAAKCISELSFQKRHDIGNRSSVTFLPMLGQCWAVSNFALELSYRSSKVQYFAPIDSHYTEKKILLNQ